MATDIRLKKSSVAGRIPDSSNLEYGEIALNYQDGKLFYKSAGGGVNAFLDSAGVDALVTSKQGLDSAGALQVIDSDYIKTVQYLDDEQLQFGVNPDLTIKHNSNTNKSEILAGGGGNLVLGGQSITLGGLAGTTNLLKTTHNAGVELYYNSSVKFETLDSGVNITGNLRINNAPASFGIDSAAVTAMIDSDYVLDRSSASFPILNEDSSLSHYEKMSFTVKTDAGGVVVLQPQVTYQDSGGTDVLVDINLSKGAFSDSDPVIDLIDSAYIQARQQLVDSASIIALVDSDYVRARQIHTIDSALAEYRFMDSGEVITLVDSAYVQARQTNFLDSSLAIQLIDSSYIQVRVPETYLATIIDSDYISDRQAAGTDSSTVITLIQSTVDSSYVQLREAADGAVVNGSVTTHTADQFTGDGSTSLFTISNSISSKAQLYVTINGVLQHTDTYSFSGANVTLDSAPETGDDVEIRLNNTQSTNITLRDYQSYFYTPDSATSVFSGQDNRGNSLSYGRGKIEVYLNGSKLVDSDDYTAQNGSQVTILGDAVDSGDTLEIISLQSAAIYDGIIFSVNKDFTTDSADQHVDTFSKTLYRTTKYIVQIEHDSDNKYHSEEILLSHTGTKVGMVTYAQLLLDSNLGSFDAELDGDNCRLLFSPTYTNTSVKVRAIRTGV